MRSNAVKKGFTLVELLVVIAIIGVLIALLLPAVQAAREAARRIDCSNRMKQIGLAVHNYHDVNRVFPAGTSSTDAATFTSGWCSNGSSQTSRAPWTVSILPFMEQGNLYDQFSLDERFTSSSNVPGVTVNDNLFRTSNDAYMCPSDPSSKPGNNYLSYMGVQGGGASPHCSNQSGQRVFYRNGVFIHNEQNKFADITDGTSNVFMVGESKYFLTAGGRSDGIVTSWASGTKEDAYGCPFTCAAAKEQINSISGSGGTRDTLNIMTRLFGSFHPTGCQFLFADGSVHFVTETIDLNEYRQLAVRNDGLPVGGYSQ